MGKSYIGVGNVAKEISKIYVGVNGVARQVQAAYIGVNGVARQIYSAMPSILYLIENGVVNTNATGGLDLTDNPTYSSDGSKRDGSYTAAGSSAYASFSLSNVSGLTTKWIWTVGFNNHINISRYNKICIDAYNTYTNSSSTISTTTLSIVNPSSTSSTISDVILNQNNKRTTYELNINNVQSSYELVLRITVKQSSGSTTYNSTRIYNLWLE